MTGAKPMFEPLVKLFAGDPGKVRRMLTVFERVTRSDMVELDLAFASGDWATIKRLVHKMKSGCMQIGAADAADGLVAIETALPTTSGEVLAQRFASVRNELDNVMQRVEGYLSTRSGVPDE